MIKKLTAYSFMLLANIILLAHAVIPHHHHEQQVCVEQTHCVDDAINHIKNIAEHNHQHDGTENMICVLKQAIIIPSSQARFINNNCSNSSDNNNYNFYIITNIGHPDLRPVSEIAAFDSQFSSFFISFVTTSIGLRAPPTV